MEHNNCPKCNVKMKIVILKKVGLVSVFKIGEDKKEEKGILKTIHYGGRKCTICGYMES